MCTGPLITANGPMLAVGSTVANGSMIAVGWTLIALPVMEYLA
jgi:hypothetical protein